MSEQPTPAATPVSPAAASGAAPGARRVRVHHLAEAKARG